MSISTKSHPPRKSTGGQGHGVSVPEAMRPQRPGGQERPCGGQDPGQDCRLWSGQGPGGERVLQKGKLYLYV